MLVTLVIFITTTAIIVAMSKMLSTVNYCHGESSSDKALTKSEPF